VGPDTSPWHGLELLEPVDDGNRNRVWRGLLGAVDVSVRESRRSSASLQWELNLIGHLQDLGFLVPTVVPAADGSLHHEGLVVQHWLSGRPPDSEGEWRSVADCLQALHAATTTYAQRPGCSTIAELTADSQCLDADLSALPPDVVDEVLAVFSAFSECATSVIHGDPGPSNLRVFDNGAIGLLDFDESRVDVSWHDLSNLGVRVLDSDSHARAQQLSDAWEAANGWVLENDYARRRLRSMRASRDAVP